MMSKRTSKTFCNRCFAYLLTFLAMSVCSATPTLACLADGYKQLNRHCLPGSRYEQILRALFGELAKPRQIAILAGVGNYPHLPAHLQLPPAEQDVEMLADVLIQNLHFDEVIVLKNETFTRDNLNYIFGIYLPQSLS